MANDEFVCRGVYTNHVKNAAGDIKNSWLSRRQLAEAQVSIWRLGQFDTQQGMVDLLASLAQEGKPLKKVLAVKAGQLRQCRQDEVVSGTCVLGDGPRRACVIDDTQISDTETHRAHAGMASCQKIDADSAQFDKIWEDTFNLYTRGSACLWSEAA